MFEFRTPQLALWPTDDDAGHWAVRESHRARRLIVRVHHSGQVEVVVPRRTSRRAVAQFLDQHRCWIERKRAEAIDRRATWAPFPPQKIELTACAQTWQVQLSADARRTRVAVLAPGILNIAGDMSDPSAVRQALRRWLMAKAHETLAPILAQTASELGFSYQQIIIRRQRTRWGSCSTRGTVSLNVSLLFQRAEVLRYLLIHELAHTRHMNHSQRFWAYVASCCPDYQALDRQLREEGWRRVPAWVLD